MWRGIPSPNCFVLRMAKPRQRMRRLIVGLFIVSSFLTLLGLWCAKQFGLWCANEAHRDENQQMAVRALLKSGAAVWYDDGTLFCEGDPTMAAPHRSSSRPGGNDFDSSVVYVDFSGRTHIPRKSAGQALDIDLEPLEHLPRVERLYLGYADRVTDAGLKHLEHLTRLRTLNLRYTSVTSAGLKHLSFMSQLQELSLGSTLISDSGLDNLRGMTHLHTLDLFGTGVTDVGLRQLKCLTELRELTLAGTHVTDAGLEELKGLSQLKLLDLSMTPATRGGINMLRHALPGCRIQADGCPFPPTMRQESQIQRREREL